MRDESTGRRGSTYGGGGLSGSLGSELLTRSLSCRRVR